MTEMFAAVRDALARALVPVVQMRVEKMPTYERPSYLPAPAPPSRAVGRAQLLELASLIPGSVRGYN